ncbi:MAG: hypothetical protein ACKO3W_13865 [bacterium]
MDGFTSSRTVLSHRSAEFLHWGVRMNGRGLAGKRLIDRGERAALLGGARSI